MAKLRITIVLMIFTLASASWAEAMVLSQTAPVASVVQSRVVALQGQANFRDLGGYLTSDGRRVRWGLIYRSGDLSALTPADYSLIKTLKLHTVCDLRNMAERTRRPTYWAAGPVQSFVSDKVDTDPAARALLADAQQTPAEARRAMKNYYAQMPAIFAPEYRAVFRHLVGGETPLLLHCTAGKDRSGVVAAFILLALGVPRATVIQDYVMTDTLLKKDRLPQLTGISPQILTILYRADPSYITAAIDAVENEYGSVDGYLSQTLGVSPTELLMLKNSLLN